MLFTKITPKNVDEFLKAKGIKASPTTEKTEEENLSLCYRYFMDVHQIDYPEDATFKQLENILVREKISLDIVLNMTGIRGKEEKNALDDAKKAKEDTKQKEEEAKAKVIQSILSVREVKVNTKEGKDLVESLVKESLDDLKKLLNDESHKLVEKQENKTK